MWSVDYFLLQEKLRQLVEYLPARANNCSHFGMRLREDLLDFFVDRPRRFFAVFFRKPSGYWQKQWRPGTLEGSQANSVAHTELGNHRSGDFSRFLKVILRARRYIAENDFLSDSAAQEHKYFSQQRGACHEVTIFGRQLLRVTKCRNTPRNNRNF